MMMRIQSLLGTMLLLGACAGAQPNARQVPVTAKFSIAVEKDTVMAPGFDGELASELRQDVLNSGNGVPVTDANAMRLSSLQNRR